MAQLKRKPHLNRKEETPLIEISLLFFENIISGILPTPFLYHYLGPAVSSFELSS